MNNEAVGTLLMLSCTVSAGLLCVVFVLCAAAIPNGDDDE